MKDRMRKIMVLMITSGVVVSMVPITAYAADSSTDESSISSATMGGGSVSAAPASASIYVKDNTESTANEYTSGQYSSYISVSDGQNIINNLNLNDSTYTDNGLVATGSDTNVLLENSIWKFTVGSTASSADTGGDALAVDDGASLFLKNDSITVDGAQRHVVSNYGNNASKLVVNQSRISSTGTCDNTSSVTEPRSNAALLIYGTARANFSIGASDTYYYNSKCLAEGWGALSTDSATGDGLDLYAYNTTAVSEKGGYGTYADTNCRVWLYGDKIESGEIGAIISKTGEVTADSGSNATTASLAYKDSKETTKSDTVIAGERNAVMMHAPDMMGEGKAAACTSTLNLSNTKLTTDTKKDSKYFKECKGAKTASYYANKYSAAVGEYISNVTGSDILVKSTSANINLNNVQMDSSNNSLVQTVINSDSMGNFLAESDGADVDPVTVNMTDMKANGNILHQDYQRRMVVNLNKNATLQGKVVSGTYSDWDNEWSDYSTDSSASNYDSYVSNWLPDSSWNTVYGITMNLNAGSEWKVTGTSTLTSLTVEKGAKLDGKVYVNGKRVHVEAGVTYTGTIVVTK